MRRHLTAIAKPDPWLPEPQPRDGHVGTARGACEDSCVDAHGLVTIMHVDVEGSTALTTRAGDEAARKS